MSFPLTRSILRAPRLLLAMAPLSLPLMAADPAAILPDESIAYLESDARGINALKDHPVAKTLPLPELEKLMFKLSRTSAEEQAASEKRIADETGVSYAELSKKAGRFALSVHDLKIPENPSPENVELEVSAAYEFDGDEALLEKLVSVMMKEVILQAEKQGSGGGQMQEFFAKAKDLLEQSTVEHNGAKIHVFKLKDTDETKNAPAFLREWAYALHEKMILAASGEAQVAEMIDRMKSGGQGSLAASPFYKRDHDRAGSTLAMASLNLETILALVKQYVLPLADSGAVDIGQIWAALGADKLQSAALALSAGSETIDFTALLNYSEKPGLFALPAIPGSGTPPAFLPRGLASAGYQQIDLLKTIENLTKLATEIEPSAGAAIQMGLEMAKGQVGVDVKKEILGQLGPDAWTASTIGDSGAKPDRGTTGASELALMGLTGGKTVAGIRLKDSKAFSLALDSVINAVGQSSALFETREYQGFTINTVKESPEEFKIAYVVTSDWLILSLGGGELLEQILGRIEKPGDDGFFAQKNITRHLEAMRGGQTSTSVADLGAALSGAFNALETLAKTSGGNVPELPFAELGKLLNVPLLSLDKSWIEETHAEYRVRIAPKGE